MTTEETYAKLIVDMVDAGNNWFDLQDTLKEYLKEKVDSCTRYDPVGDSEMEWFPNGDYIEYAALIA